MSELEPAPDRWFAVPLTGEAVDTYDGSAVTEALVEVREYERQFREARGFLTDCLHVIGARLGAKTFRFGPYEVKLSGGSQTVYDGARLAAELEAAGMPPERVAEIVKPEVTWKV